MLGGTLIGVALGLFPNIVKGKPVWWRALTVFAVTITIFCGLYPPVAGTFTDAVVMSRVDSSAAVPVLVRLVRVATADSTGIERVQVNDARDERVTMTVTAKPAVLNQLLTSKGSVLVIDVRRKASDTDFEVIGIGQSDPLFTLPYIIGLGERARIIFFHVPMSWVAVVAYLMSMIFAIMFLRTGNIENDVKSAAVASVGTLYAILATTTGAVWAKFNWGSFWNWDPRETSIFLLLMVYAAYFLLRSAIKEPMKRARLSSAYSIVAFVTVPFLIFVLPRILPGLHPGSADDSNIGPLLSPKSDAINVVKQYIFGWSLFSFTLVFFWLTNLKIRATTLLQREKS